MVVFIGPKATELLETFTAASKWTLPTDREAQDALRSGCKITPPPGLIPSAKTVARLLACSASTVRRDLKRKS
jgi:hypothetical protein